MKLMAGVLCSCCCIALLASPVGSCQESSQEGSAVVEGLVVDILDGRIPEATVTFWRGADEVVTKTRHDGIYSVRLMPGTYTMSVSKNGFYTARRGAFILQEHSSVRFNFQMWVSVYDLWPVFHDDELEEVPHTNLKPLILYGKNESQGDLLYFYGWNTPDDGTRHARQYPVILTFNLLTVKADKITYRRSDRTFAASGNVAWEDNTASGAGTEVQVVLDGFKPKPM